MNFYKPETVKRGVKISRYLEDQGVKVRGNRAVASWRGGERESVSIDDEKCVWHDFTADEGGDVIALFIRIEGGTFLGACRTLGDRYNLEPDKKSTKPKKKTRGEMLVDDGFRLVKSYPYLNADGTPRYFVDRYERINADGKREKEFVQRGPDSDNLAGIEKTLYNLPSVLGASRVFVCEGEKDCDTLTALGLTATTNSGGAKFWTSEFSRVFADKEAVILTDNDEPGRNRGERLAADISKFARSVKVLSLSKLQKGDVTDWIEREGGNLSSLIECVNAAPESSVSEERAELTAAKVANEDPLLNYTTEWITDEKGKAKAKHHPRTVDDICDDMAKRFLGFPKRIGENLFDHTRGTVRRIELFHTPDALRAWIDGTSGHQSHFICGGPFAGYREVYERLLQTRPRYDVIARAPWYPVRDDAFATFGKLPTPDATGTNLDELMSFFLPATPADATLMRAFFFAPMFNSVESRPAWVIDTVDAQGSGKTTVVKACCRIYDENPLKFDLQQLTMDVTKIKREVLSSEGRKCRIVLFDNVTTSFKSGSLADFITADVITGMAPYGRTVETRRNDITWCATVNGASVDTDMAARSYVIHIKSPGAMRDPTWETRLNSFIEANRPQIQADIMDALRNAKPRSRANSRFGTFDSVVLSAACRDDADFAAVAEKITSASAAANDDADLAEQCVEAITNALTAYDEPRREPKVDPSLPCAIRCTDVDTILRNTKGGVCRWTSKVVRRFVNAGHISCIEKGVERVESDSAKRLLGRSRVFVYYPEGSARSLARVQAVRLNGLVPSVAGIFSVGP